LLYWGIAMHKKYFIFAAIVAFILMIVITVLGYQRYRDYRERQERYRQALQQRAEENTITIIEGWSVKEIADYLEAEQILTAKVFLADMKTLTVSDYSLLASKPKTADLQGFLFPDTYRIPKPATSAQIMNRMLRNFTAKVSPLVSADIAAGVADARVTVPQYERLSSGGKSGLSFYQILTLAAIVEKETGRDVSEGTVVQQARLEEERRVVAGIFYNRLLRGMALESDATVNYATGKKRPAATLADLEVDSPYNTYKYAGLPPGPITNPSLSSIQAALKPLKTDYYYFLHKQPSGEVVYSKTFTEHVQNKVRYLR
jgi:UPF0755 protein